MDETTPNDFISPGWSLIFSGRQLIISTSYPTSAEHYSNQDYESPISASPYLIIPGRHLTSPGHHSLTMGSESIFSSAHNILRHSHIANQVLFISAGSCSLTMDPERSISSGCSLATPRHITSEGIFIGAGPFFTRPSSLSSEGLIIIISAGLVSISQNPLFIGTDSISLTGA
jgi:hypothetical protein